MIEASIGVVLWLSVALLVGTIVGWYLNTAMQQKEGLIELDVLQKHYEEKESQVEKLKEDYFSQKRNLDRLTDEGIVCRHQLLQKSNFLTKTSDELFRVQDKLREVKRIEKERDTLEHTVTELNIRLHEKEDELKEFEKVLLKADASLSDEMTQSIREERREVQAKQRKILMLESEIERLRRLTDSKERVITGLSEQLTHSGASEGEEHLDQIVISKDQFHEIEKRLAEYTERVKKLEEENIKLSQSYILQPKDHALNALIKSYESIQGWKEGIKQKFFPAVTTKA